MAEKKKTEGAKKTSRKKTGSKTGASKSGKGPGRKTGKLSRPARNFSPVFVLIIMVLTAVIIFLLNKAYYKEEESGKAHNQPPSLKDKDKSLDAAGRENEKEREKDRGETAGKTEDNFLEAKVYFVKINEATENMTLVPVKRRVSGSNKVEGALKELIRGLSKKERDSGLLNAVPQDLKIRSIRVNNRTAIIDFNGSIEKDAAGSILLSRLDQIVYTATQFSDVESVIITINGKKRNTLGSDGLSINGPLHRRE